MLGNSMIDDIAQAGDIEAAELCRPAVGEINRDKAIADYGVEM